MRWEECVSARGASPGYRRWSNYYERERAEGMISCEALRCLERRLSDVVHRALRADQDASQPVAIAGAA